MAGPIVLSSIVAQWVTIDCPMCGYRKKVQKKPVARRVCPRCRKYFQDPLADVNSASGRDSSTGG